uniref:RNA 3'-terminal phosphate cyclase n=1 Tax=Petromyzon marinus TaxID=7757 RepID=S4RXT9_PETMA
MSEREPMHVDGDTLEGGGQILRVSSALSCILGKPIHLTKIRAGRPKPGLRPQHLMGLSTLRDLCGGRLVGAEINSCEVTLYPGQIQGGSHRADTQTAGSVCLMVQSTLPCILFAARPSALTLRGGTNVSHAPQIDYTTTVFKPFAEKFGIKFDCDVRIRGYEPKGGGELVLSTAPVRNLEPITVTERGDITKIYGRAYVAGVLPIKMAKDAAATALRKLKQEFRDINVNISAVQEPRQGAFGNGNGIIVFAETSTGCIFAGDALGRRGVTPEQLGTNAAEMLLSNIRHGGCVDEHLQDQLLGFVLIKSSSKKAGQFGRVSQNTLTALLLIFHFAEARFTVSKTESQLPNADAYIIECQGMGASNPNI